MRILHISDTHFFRPSMDENDIVALSHTVREMIDRYSIDLCIHTGDIINRPPRAWKYKLYLKHWPSCIHVPGNHDDPELMKELFPEMGTGFPYITDHHGIRFIGLDSSTGTIGEKQGCRLNQILSEGGSCILMLHHQISPLGDSWMDRYVLEDHTVFQGILKQHQDRIDAVFHGHFHNRQTYNIGAVKVFSGASAAFQYDPRGAHTAIKSQVGEAAVYEAHRGNDISCILRLGAL